jgi:hypothetical protein
MCMGQAAACWQRVGSEHQQTVNCKGPDAATSSCLTFSSMLSLSLMLTAPLGSTTLTAQGAAAAAWRQDLHDCRAAATDLESVR